jgi:cyclophilin family peptidyl-prolyl cis-trans isomerase
MPFSYPNTVFISVLYIYTYTYIHISIYTSIHLYITYSILPGMARNNEAADSGSSQFFMLKWNQALIAPGRNTLDGFYSSFGYITSNEQMLSQVGV